MLVRVLLVSNDSYLRIRDHSGLSEEPSSCKTAKYTLNRMKHQSNHKKINALSLLVLIRLTLQTTPKLPKSLDSHRIRQAPLLRTNSRLLRTQTRRAVLSLLQPTSTNKKMKMSILMCSLRIRLAVPSKSLVFWARWACPSIYTPVISPRSQYNALEKPFEMAMPRFRFRSTFFFSNAPCDNTCKLCVIIHIRKSR